MSKTSARQKIFLWLLVGLLPCLAWNLMTFESRSLFHPHSSDFPSDPLAAIARHPLRSRVQEISFMTQDGQILNGWYVPAQQHKPTIVFAHGNGGNIGDRYAMLLPFIQKGYGFLAFDYRGYGKSTGSPSEEGFYKDMQAASRYLQQVQQIPPDQQIAMGESIGSAVAVESASHIPFRAVVIFSTLTNTPAVASHLRDTNGLGWLSCLPITQIMRQRFDSLARMHHIHAPLIIMHGEADSMMPLSMPKTLYAQAGSRHKKLLIIPQAGHNNVLMLGEQRLLPALDALLTETVESPSAQAG